MVRFPRLARFLNDEEQRLLSSPHPLPESLPEQPGGRGVRQLLLLVVLPFLAYLPSLWGGFLGDDVQILLHPTLEESGGLQDVLFKGYHHPFDDERNEYRPLTSVSLWLQAWLGGRDPLPFHAVNVLLHIAVALALRWFLLPLAGPSTAFLAALLFALHPLGSEAVCLIVGRADLLAAFFALLTWGLYLRERRGWALLTAVLAVLAKESGLAALGVVFLLELLGPFRAERRGVSEAVRRVGILWWTPVVYLAVRLLLLGPVWFEEVYSWVDNPLVAVSTPQRIATALWVLVKGWWLFLWPAQLSSDYSYNQIPLIEAWGDLRLVAALVLPLAVLVFAWLAYRRGHSLALWAVLSQVGLGLVTSNLLVPIGTIFGERLLYLPSIPLAILAGHLLARLVESPPDARSGLAGLLPLLLLGTLFASLGARTLTRTFDWHDESTLLTAQLESAPQSVRTYKNLASWSLREGDPRAVLEAIEGAHQITEAWADTWLLQAEALLVLGRPAESVAAMERALSLGENRPGAFVLLARGLASAGRVDEARAVLDRALQMYPGEGRLVAARSRF